MPEVFLSDILQTIDILMQPIMRHNVIDITGRARLFGRLEEREHLARLTALSGACGWAGWLLFADVEPGADSGESDGRSSCQSVSCQQSPQGKPIVQHGTFVRGVAELTGMREPLYRRIRPSSRREFEKSEDVHREEQGEDTTPLIIFTLEPGSHRFTRPSPHSTKKIY